MAEYDLPVDQRTVHLVETPFSPYWERSKVQYAQNLLECTGEPIEYDHEDEDYRDNCFFFPEDCIYTPSEKRYQDFPFQKCGFGEDVYEEEDDDDRSDEEMIPELPDIKMLDSAALGDLLEDNLSPPEITSIMVFATNGAIFAHASPLSPRDLRSLSATYGAAYTCYAKNASSGNLTGINPSSHPSSYVTAQSFPLGDVGSIVFELDKQVAVVTKIGDKVLLAVIGPRQLDEESPPESKDADGPSTTEIPGPESENANHATSENSNSTVPANQDSQSRADGNQGSPSNEPPQPTQQQQHHELRKESEAPPKDPNRDPQSNLETQWEIDRSNDLARLGSLNLASSPSILFALESKSAALGRFLGQKLEDLDNPEDF